MSKRDYVSILCTLQTRFKHISGGHKAWQQISVNKAKEEVIKIPREELFPVLFVVSQIDLLNYSYNVQIALLFFWVFPLIEHLCPRSVLITFVGGNFWFLFGLKTTEMCNSDSKQFDRCLKTKIECKPFQINCIKRQPFYRSFPQLTSLPVDCSKHAVFEHPTIFPGSCWSCLNLFERCCWHQIHNKWI